MDPVVYSSRPEMERPVLVTAFRGWNDAGEAASTAAGFLKDAWDAEPFALIDPEEFFDFQVARPTVRLAEGVTRVIEWPECEFSHARVDGRDVVIFTGIEPNVRWRTFGNSIVEVGKTLGAERLVTLGAFLADVPHTRPVPVVGSASSPEEAERLGLQMSRYEGPTGIVGVLHDLSNRGGLPSVSFWAAAPHYVQAGVNPRATLALVERLTDFLGVTADVASLAPAIAAWEQQVNEIVAENETLTEYVRRLEQAAGEEPPMPSASGESLAEEVEEFLREHGGGTSTP
ncbi:MAG TPA: PAC2 family protein [Actinomycetota bacterium]|nr:PAC2 family protein [Actinomycetota bacterium]